MRAAVVLLHSACVLLVATTESAGLGDDSMTLDYQVVGEPPGLAAIPPAGFKARFWNHMPRFEKMTEALTFMSTHPPREKMGISTLSFRGKEDASWQGLDSSFKNNFGATFVGCLLVQQKGEYRFWTRSNDGSALWVNDKLVVNNDGIHGMNTRSGSMEMKRGVFHLRVAYWKREGAGAVLQAGWEGPGQQDQEFSASNVYHTTGPLDASCADIDTLETRDGKHPGTMESDDGVEYPEEVAQTAMDATAERELISSRLHTRASEQEAARLESLEMAADRASRERTDKSVGNMRMEMQNSSHPGLDQAQIEQATASDQQKVRATREAVAEATARMEALIKGNDSQPITIRGYPEQNVSHHIARAAYNGSISALDPTADSKNAYNDGSIAPGSSEDPTSVNQLASKNKTQVQENTPPESDSDDMDTASEIDLLYWE